MSCLPGSLESSILCSDNGFPIESIEFCLFIFFENDLVTLQFSDSLQVWIVLLFQEWSGDYDEQNFGSQEQTRHVPWGLREDLETEP